MPCTSNIRYDKPQRCVLDVYSPDDDGAPNKLHPVMVCLHGGGWSVGDKRDAEEMSKDVSAHGYIVIAPCYRLSTFSDENIKTLMFIESVLVLIMAFLSNGNNIATLVVLIIFFIVIVVMYVITKPRQIIQHPVHANDVAEVIRWTYQNIRSYGGDPNNIHIMGHSAGGHLAAIVSTNPDYLRRVNLPNTIIRSTICISGVFSDKRMQETKIGNEILHNAFNFDSLNHMQAFPIYHAQPTSPPHLLINAEFDYTLKKHTLDYALALRQKGVFVQTRDYKGTNHFNIRRGWSSKNSKVLTSIIDFLDTVASSRALMNNLEIM